MKQLQSKYFVNIFISVIVFTVFIASCAVCTTSPEVKNAKVLVIHSFRDDFVSYPEMNRLILEELQEKEIDATVQTFYLNCDGLNAEEEQAILYQYVDTMGVRPDIILTTDDQASYSLLSCNHPFLLKKPIIFTGVNFPNWDLLKKHPNVTGIWDKVNYLANVKMIEQLMGHQRIRFYYDRTYIGCKILSELAEQIGDRDKEMYDMLQHYLQYSNTAVITKTEYKPGFLKEKELSEELEATTFYFLNLREVMGSSLLWCINGKFDRTVSLLTRYDYTMSRIGRMATIPTFTTVNEGVGYGQGILGGYFMTTEDQVKEGCDYVAQILKGRAISTLPVKEGRQSFVLDWTEMERWGIKESSVPEDYHIVNMPFYEEFKTEFVAIGILLGGFILSIMSYLLFLFMRELKRKKQVQQTLREEKEYLSLVLEGGNIFAWSYDQVKDEFLFDKDFTVSVGLRSEWVTFEELAQMTHPDDVENAISQLMNVVNRREDKASVSVRIDFVGNDYVWYEFRMLGIPKRKNNHVVAIGVILCIQDFKENEQELIMARDLAAKTELKQSFLANMSHEIRTPLNAIVGFSNILVMDDDINEEEKKEFATTINLNCELLLKLINDILEISRIESGNMSFVMESYSINAIVEEVYKMNYLAVSPSVSFCTELLTEDVLLVTDRARLKQVLNNFVNNAFKFTSLGYVKMGATCDKNKKEICLYVEDTGVGIPVDEQKMIFERFYKCDEFAQGTGLGLSICGVIAEKLNGKITLESEQGRGSRFGIVLPCQLDSLEKNDANICHNLDSNTDAYDEDANGRPTILIAEDSVSNYMVLSHILKKYFTIVWALNGQDALDIVNKQPIDLVLMDIKMHEMDGLTALKRIKKTHKKLPVIMQTAYAYEENREQAKRAGCVDFIEKPIQADVLMEAIGKCISIPYAKW